MSAQSVGRIVCLGGNIRQPDRVLADAIAGDKAERRPGAGEEWLAPTKHDGVEIEPVFIDQTEIGQALRQDWSAAGTFEGEFSNVTRSYAGRGVVRYAW